MALPPSIFREVAIKDLETFHSVRLFAFAFTVTRLGNHSSFLSSPTLEFSFHSAAETMDSLPFSLTFTTSISKLAASSVLVISLPFPALLLHLCRLPPFRAGAVWPSRNPFDCHLVWALHFALLRVFFLKVCESGS